MGPTRAGAGPAANLPPVSIGPHTLRNPVVLAPMAGVTDPPFRELAWALGAGLVVGEMTSADPALAHTEKSRRRRAPPRDAGPRVVQVAGADPKRVADAVRREQAAGADVIDINMGCPAKKVCNRAAGSALLRDEGLVEAILTAAVAAAAVPVTVKIRTGWSPEHRNGLVIAKIAEAAGVRSIAVHGRTRACRFSGAVEYDTIAAIKQAVRIPVLANGDIDSGERALAVLRHTGADGVLIGRAALGAPWVPGDVARFLATGEPPRARAAAEVVGIITRHLRRLHEFYGEALGVRVARKHVKAYLQRMHIDPAVIRGLMAEPTAAGQLRRVAALVAPEGGERAA